MPAYGTREGRTVISPATQIFQLTISCALYVVALALLCAWGLGRVGLTPAVVVAVLAWCIAPNLNEFEEMLDRLREHQKS